MDVATVRHHMHHQRRQGTTTTIALYKMTRMGGGWRPVGLGGLTRNQSFGVQYSR